MTRRVSVHSTAMTRITTVTLACGLPLIVEKIPGVSSCGLTWLMPGGTAREPAELQGLGAMWSELLQRGAGALDSRAQADAFDRLGVSRGAGIETFHMAVSATLLGSRLGAALPLIVDMVRRPRMDDADFEPTRDLCLQAIESLKDDPQERLMIVLKARHAPPPINRSGLGTPEGLARITPTELRQQWGRIAAPRGGVLALAGDVDADAAAKQLDSLLAGWEGSASEVRWSDATTRGAHHEHDQTNQVHIGVAYDGPAESEEGCWEERLATAVLSAGMASRLFSEVREKRGLCYSVYASYAADARFGRTVAYVGTTPDKAQQSLEVLLGELRRVRMPQGRVTQEEFDRAVVGMKSKLVMSGESSSARSSALARDWHKLGRPRSLDELARTVDALSLERVNAWLERRSTLGSTTVVTLGPAELRVPGA